MTASEQLWQAGRVETEHGLCAWPSMRRRDAERFPPARTELGAIPNCFEAGSLTIDGIPFRVRIEAPQRGLCRVALEILPGFVPPSSDVPWGQREQALILDLFQKHLGSTVPRHWRPWGEIQLIHDDKSSGEPFIRLIYRSKLAGWTRFAWHALTGW